MIRPLPYLVPRTLVGCRLRRGVQFQQRAMPRRPIIGDQLYVAQDLTSIVIEGDYAHTVARDLTRDGIAYRRLDASWYAWIYSHMAAQQQLHDADRLSDQAWEQYRARFAVIYAWARKTLSEVAMATAHLRGPGQSYAPPRPRAA